MASWGRTADSALTGTVSITADETTATGTGTAFTTEADVGNIIVIGTDVFNIVSITSDTELEVSPAATTTLTGETVLLSDSPQYLPADELDYVTYVETGEIDANTRVDGVKTPGWTLYEEYGNGRKRVEVLVAMKSTS